MGELIRCPRCRRSIDVSAIVSSPDARCPLCSRTFEAVRFEPLVRSGFVAQGIDGRLDAAQPCANHSGNAAVTSCERCGSFMCALCRIDLDGRTLCPTCFERLSAEGTLESTRTSFRDYGGLATVAVVAGVFLWFLSVLFGVLAIYYGVKGLRQKKQMGERDGVIGVWIAMFFGSLEAIGGLALIVLLASRLLR